MLVSWKDWERYIERLRRVNDEAADLIRDYIANNGLPIDKAATEKMIDFAYWVSEKYGEAATTVAAEMYDAVAVASKAKVLPAAPAPAPEFGEIAKTVVGTLKTGNTEIISSAIGRLVKRTGVDTTMQNALRDGAQWAWIPHGDTCAFCITLASRGWQRASKKAIKNGHAEHIHANCDCTYAIRFDSDTDVQGYEPDLYLKMYYSASPGGTPTDKINAMRREFYAENKEKINEQKRSAYAKRKERESSKAEEINVT